MKDKNDFASYEKITGDTVIDSGYAIYDEWNQKKLRSKQVVRFVEKVAYAKNTDSPESYEALACLFALDMRINEKYNSLLRRVFLYFAWRREMRAFKLLKGILNIKKNEDVRDLIEQKLRQLRDGVESENDEDDDVGGGKRNGSPDEAEITSEKGREEKTADNTVEDTVDREDGKEYSEEKAEEHTEETAEVQEDIEALQEDSKETVQKTGEQVNQEEYVEIKEENNGPDKGSEPSNDKVTEKATEAKTYNDAVDSPPLFEVRESKKQTDTSTVSFIDEVIMDNMIKGKEDIIGHNPLLDVKEAREANQNREALSVALQDGKSGEADKDTFLYDETETSENKDVEWQVRGTETVNGNNAHGDNVREPIQVDMTADHENEMRRSISESMSEEAIKAFYNQQAEAMREQLNIASAKAGIDVPVEIIGKPESATIERPKTVPSRK